MSSNKTPKQPTKNPTWQGNTLSGLLGLSEGLALGLITAFVIGLFIYCVF